MPDLRPSPTHAALKILNRLRARGVGEVLALGRDRVSEYISSSEELIILARASGGPSPPSEDLRFQDATAADGARYARDIGTDSASTFSARLANDTHCFLVCSGEKVLHATWVTTRAAWTRELRGYFIVPPGDCYVYESFTRGDARGKGVYPFALKSICAWASTENLRRIWVGVEAGNGASLRAVGKAGFEPQLTITFRRNVGRLEVSGGKCPDEAPETLCFSETI
ncbi:MAG: GNAT family N-acetyltransferase [Actinomycetota bacterium]